MTIDIENSQIQIEKLASILIYDNNMLKSCFWGMLKEENTLVP